jgi:hypothetical protein
MIQTYRYLDLPAPPEHLITACWDVIKQPDEMPKYGVSDYPNYKFMSIPKGSELEAWLLTNLKIPRHEIFHVHVMEKSVLMHKDWMRKWSLNYILTTGGNKVATHFHKDSGKIFESVVLEPLRWHQLNSQCNHSVSGFEPNTQRVALVLGMDNPVL